MDAEIKPRLKAGRKPKAPADRRVFPVTGHLTSAEHDEVRRLQRCMNGAPESEVVRVALLEYAKKR